MLNLYLKFYYVDGRFEIEFKIFGREFSFFLLWYNELFM